MRLSLAAGLGGAAAAIIGGALSGGLHTGAALLGATLGFGAAFGLGALTSWPLDAALARVARALMSDGEEGVGQARTPGWLRPLMTSIEESRDRLTEQARRASARLRELEIRHRVAEVDRRQLESTLNGLRDAVLVTDAFDELVFANNAAASIFGFDPAMKDRRPVFDVIDVPSVTDLIQRTRESGAVGDRKHGEFVVPAPIGTDGRPRGEETAYEVAVSCLPDTNGQGCAGAVTILRDVTREREISRMKSDFVSQVSHELRTPLSSIHAYIEMLLDGEAQDEEGRHEFYSIIKNEADRLGRLIDNMLNISRIEAGIVQVERDEVDFVDVASEVVEVMQPQAMLKRITLIKKAGPLVYTAYANRDMMHQVMLNLVSNAVKYTPDEGRVTVSVENDDATRSVLVSVSDTGLGIPPDAIDRVFEKFYRIDNYKRVAKGTGLGLNLVKHIVETVHRGRVGVESSVGMGSRFWFSIPFEDAGAKAA